MLSLIFLSQRAAHKFMLAFLYQSIPLFECFPCCQQSADHLQIFDLITQAAHTKAISDLPFRIPVWTILSHKSPKIESAGV
jgi:hypothetical protein